MGNAVSSILPKSYESIHNPNGMIPLCARDWESYKPLMSEKKETPS